MNECKTSRLQKFSYVASKFLPILFKYLYKIKFNNKYVLYKIKELAIEKNKKIINELKTIVPLVNDYNIMAIYNKSISLHQSTIQNNGYFLENNILVDILNYYNITYKQQVSIDKNGIIYGFNNKKNKCYHIIDFVIGNNINIGNNISLYKVISCKTTCRERWTQDNWTLTISPNKYILLTISNDYPRSIRFRESEKRKIITCNPKNIDDRIYKLNFEDIFNELK
jgi:hypothetical protein